MQKSDLFRSEAVEFQTNLHSIHGRPTVRLPQSWWSITFLVLVFLACVAVFVWNIDFARKETVRGKLRFDGAESSLVTLAPGTVSRVHVLDGSEVEQGDLIAEIETIKVDRSGVSVTQLTKSEIQKQIELLLISKKSMQETADLASSSSRQKLDYSILQEDEQRKTLELTDVRLATAVARHKAAKDNLSEGLITEPQYHEYADVEIQLKQARLRAEAEISQLISVQEQLRLEIAQIDSKLKTDLSRLDQQISQLETQLTQTDVSEYQSIRSPIDGRITALRVRNGESVGTGSPIAVVLPSNSVLFAELYIPSRAIGFAESGQLVKLQYDAFPYQKFGISEGVVRRVAKTARRPDELGVATQTGELLYVVEVELGNQYVNAFQKEMPLQAGMELTADIVLEKRRLIEWLLEPFMR